MDYMRMGVEEIPEILRFYGIVVAIKVVLWEGFCGKISFIRAYLWGVGCV